MRVVSAIIVICLIGYFSQAFKTQVGKRRNKRYIYFPNGGLYKMNFGVGMPVPLPKLQMVGFAFNVQFQYPQLANLSEIAGGLPPTINNRRRRSLGDQTDRNLTYVLLEAIMNKYGANGKACLLRSICENAMHSLDNEENGIYGRILNIILTPGYGNEEPSLDVGEEYFEAKQAGSHGVDCLSLYPDCYYGHGFLDIISTLENY